jgi:DNA-binding transcriptional LysR family regulator
MSHALRRAATPSLAGLDLQLLVALQLLLDSRSVTVTARKLRVSQSAMSHTLRRLRLTFDDPLLVRGQGGMVLTARAAALREPLQGCLDLLAHLTKEPRRFDPASTRAAFRIAASDFLAFRFAPTLAAILEREAPGAQLEIKQVAIEGYPRLLETGELDVMVGGSLLPQPPGLRCRELATEPMGCVVRARHPRIGAELTLAQYVAERHVLVTPTQRDNRGVVDSHLEQLGLRRTVGVCVTSFLLAPHVVSRTDLILTAPRTLLEAFALPLGLRLLAPPVELAAFAVRMLWHERAHLDSAQDWLRGAVARAYGNVEVATAPRSSSRVAARRR